MSLLNIVSELPGTRRTYKPESTVIYQSEVPRSGFFIVRGLVKVYTLQSSGEERIVGFYTKGDIFPISWLFSKTNNATYYYETLDLTEMIALSRNDISDNLLKNDEAKMYLLDKLVMDNTAQQMRITALEQPRAIEKILFTLYFLLYQFGKTKDNKKYKIDIKLTHATIASLVGITRETTAVELNKLKNKNILDYKGKIYTINRLKLEKAINEDGFSEIIA